MDYNLRMIKSLFVNLAIKNKNASKAFFESLGMTFNSKYEDETGCCLVITDTIYAMLLEEKKFKGFTDKEICDTTKSTEVLLALQVESKEEVDAMMEKIVAAGGKDIHKVQEFDFMYGRDFEDLDGHIWEVFWMKDSI